MKNNLEGIVKWLYEIGNGLAKAMYLHVLWFLFILLGLGLFGIMPATAALFSVAHNSISGNERSSTIFRSFFDTYKKNFIKSNLLGFILVGVGFFLWMDLTISKQWIQSSIVHFFLLIIIFLYGLLVLYFFPVYVRYQLKGWQYYKQAFLISLARPFETIAILICLVLIYILVSYLPVLLFYLGSSLVAYPIMWFAYRACLGVEESKKLKKEKDF